MKTKEVADICGVTEECIRQNAKKIGIVLENGKAHEYTEDELKKIQLELMKNQATRGNMTTDTVCNNLQFNLGLGVLTQKAMEDPDASRQLANLLISNANNFQKAQKLEVENKELEQKNQLLIEQKEAAEAETERIFKYNENFHNHLYTATDLAKMLGTNPNKIGRIATKFHLKQEPIYGKLGKMQVKNGRWVDIFYYNEDAKVVIENNL